MVGAGSPSTVQLRRRRDVGDVNVVCGSTTNKGGRPDTEREVVCVETSHGMQRNYSHQRRHWRRVLEELKSLGVKAPIPFSWQTYNPIFGGAI